MSDFLKKIPFIRLFIPLCAGIIYYHYNEKAAYWVYLFLAAYFILLCTYFVINLKHQRWKEHFFAICLHLFLVLTGFGSAYINSDNLSRDHYSHHLSMEPEAFVAGVIEIPKTKKESQRLLLSLESCKIKGDWKRVSGTVMAYVKGTEKKLEIGNRILFRGKFISPQGPVNPYEFDYQSYLQNKNIFHQIFLKETEFSVIGSFHGSPLMNLARGLKRDLYENLTLSGLKEDERAIASALLMGYDDDISSDLMKAYASTGTLHVLSVSGLHVGLLFLILNFLLAFPPSKKMQVLKNVIILLLIWFYALLTGLSPSVVRACTMFGFILLGKILDRRGSIYNTLLASAFCILLFRPNFLFDNGFQLSYIAVIGIVYFHPIIFNWIYVSNRFLRLVWNLIAVSVSAQIATLPITLLYFGQFPGLFILSNLIIIPLSNIALFGALLSSITSFFPIVQNFFSSITAFIIRLMNNISLGMDAWPFGTLGSFSIDTFLFLLLCFFIISLSVGWVKKSFHILRSALICGISILLYSIILDLKADQQKETLIYQLNQNTSIDLVSGRSCININTQRKTDNSPLQPQSYRTKKRLNSIDTLVLAKGIYKLKCFETEYLLLNNCNTNLYDSTLFINKKLILLNDPFLNKKAIRQAQLIIADGSNSNRTLRFLTEKIKLKNEQLWLTKENGAYLFQKD